MSRLVTISSHVGIVLLVVSMILANGCSDQNRLREFSLYLPDNISQEAKNILTEVWPKVRAAAPGLDKYASVLKIVGVTDWLDFADKDYQRVTVEILCPEDKSIIPGEYRSWGQHCFLDISKDRSTLTIAKESCQSVLLDKKVAESRYPLVLSLVSPGTVIEETEGQYIRSASKIVFTKTGGIFHKEFLKNPKKYEGTRLSMLGEIMHIEEEGGRTYLQAYINRNYDSVIVLYPGSSPVYKGDLVRIIGEGAGTVDGKNRFGVDMSWPLIKAKYIKKANQ